MTNTREFSRDSNPGLQAMAATEEVGSGEAEQRSPRLSPIVIEMLPVSSSIRGRPDGESPNTPHFEERAS
jgi:hypothetical protein